LRDEDRMWEEGYRQRWQHDKIVRSTHGVNCTGSCSWKIYVKSGVVTWETQQTDYPRTRPGMPNQEPRGCSRGASYSWYLYSASRIKYPLVRGRLVKAWREARKTRGPVEAWAAIAGDAERAKSYKSMRGHGGFVRATWDRGERDHRRLQRPHHQDLGTGSCGRFLADPRDVDGLLRFRRPLSQPDRRHALVVLRLVLRPAAFKPADLGRADRRARIGRLVQFRVYHRLGLERAADAHARRTFLRRSPIQRHQGRGDHPRTIPRSPNSPTSGFTRSRAPMRRSPWPWVM
jgi:hypothetical protein